MGLWAVRRCFCKVLIERSFNTKFTDNEYNSPSSTYWYNFKKEQKWLNYSWNFENSQKTNIKRGLRSIGIFLKWNRKDLIMWGTSSSILAKRKCFSKSGVFFCSCLETVRSAQSAIMAILQKTSISFDAQYLSELAERC